MNAERLADHLASVQLSRAFVRLRVASERVAEAKAWEEAQKRAKAELKERRARAKAETQARLRQSAQRAKAANAARRQATDPKG